MPIAALVRPALTTLRIEIAETGRRAMERLVGLIAASDDATPDDACEIVRPHLVVRQSSGGAHSNVRATAQRIAPNLANGETA